MSNRRTALFVLLAALGACNSYNAEPANVYTYETGKSTPAIEAREAGLKGTVQATEIIGAEEDGILKIQAHFKNTGSGTERREYRVIFYNASGLELSDPRSRWEPVVFSGNETKGLSATAPSKGAVKAKIYMRRDSALR